MRRDNFGDEDERVNQDLMERPLLQGENPNESDHLIHEHALRHRVSNPLIEMADEDSSAENDDAGRLHRSVIIDNALGGADNSMLECLRLKHNKSVRGPRKTTEPAVSVNPGVANSTFFHE